MSQSSDGATHLQCVTFTISYPQSPFFPSVPVLAQFSGVLTAEGQIHVRLDGGSIPCNPPPGPAFPSRGLSPPARTSKQSAIPGF